MPVQRMAASPYVASPYVASPYVASSFVASSFVASSFVASPFALPEQAVLARTSASPANSTSRLAHHNALPPEGAVLNVRQDREIYCEGDPATLFFKVESGVVRTCKFLDDGRRQIDAFHIAGEVFGFEAGADYRLSAEAVCDCRLISYSRQELQRLAAVDFVLLQQLYCYAMRSMTRAQDHSLLLGRKGAVGKVSAFLMEWAHHSASAGMIILAMTRQDIADYLGLTIETVSRTLSQLERDGVIELPTARQIRFKDLAALRHLDS